MPPTFDIHDKKKIARYVELMRLVHQWKTSIYLVVVARPEQALQLQYVVSQQLGSGLESRIMGVVAWQSRWCRLRH